MSRLRGGRFPLMPLFVLLLITQFALGADDFRTWSDASGQFKIEAKFVSEKNGNVTLKQEDGEELEIPLAKLSEADQKFVAEAKKKAADNPFKSKSANPFKSKESSSMPGKSSPGKKDTSDSSRGSGGEPREIKVNWSDVQVVPFTDSGSGWKIEVPDGLDKEAFKPKPVALPPKKDFWEGLKRIAASPDGKKVVVGYLHEEPKPTGTPRLVICDLETGKVISPPSSTGMMIPLALHNDGKHVLMRSTDGPVFGKHERLEIWNVAGSKIEKQVSWMPYPDADDHARDIQWGRFIGTDKFATYGNKEVVVWSFPEIEPLFKIAVDGDGVPALSPDGKHLAICDGKVVGILDLETRTVVATQSLPSPHFPWPSLAFSANGSRLAAASLGHVIVWETATGELATDVPSVGQFQRSPLLFPDDDYLLMEGKLLFGVGNHVKLWSYEGAEQYAMAGPFVVFVATDQMKAGTVMAGKLPHQAALDELKKALTDPTLFILRAGVKVKLDVDGITDGSRRDAAAKGLTERLKAIGCDVDRNGTITLAASTEGPKEEKTIRFSGAGDYKTREYITRVKFVYEGKTVWEQAKSSLPSFMVFLSAGENIDSYLKKNEKPNYELFEQIELPRFLQKPMGGSGNNNSVTLGTSRVTPSGIR